jgi:hypothetical protein
MTMQDQGIRRVLGLGLLLVGLVQAHALERTLAIQAPATAAAGQPFDVVLAATTDAGHGEQVGFLQADVSINGGETWSALCYLQESGPKVAQTVKVTPGAAGTIIKLRVRAAFRGGLAGDVDYAGAALRWHDAWKEWLSPPARHAVVKVTAP